MQQRKQKKLIQKKNVSFRKCTWKIKNKTKGLLSGRKGKFVICNMTKAKSLGNIAIYIKVKTFLAEQIFWHESSFSFHFSSLNFYSFFILTWENRQRREFIRAPYKRNNFKYVSRQMSREKKLEPLCARGNVKKSFFSLL